MHIIQERSRLEHAQHFQALYFIGSTGSFHLVSWLGLTNPLQIVTARVDFSCAFVHSTASRGKSWERRVSKT